MLLHPARQLVPRPLEPVQVRVLQLVGLPVKIRRRKWRQICKGHLGEPARAVARQLDPVWHEASLTGSLYQRLQRHAMVI